MRKLEIITSIQVNRSEAHSICNLKFNVPNKLPIVCYNGSSFRFNRKRSYRNRSRWQ